MASQDEKINDFYGIYEEGNWLNGIANLPRPIYGAAPATQYFQRMSQAMAESCSGEVIILTERPDTFHDTYSTRLNTANEYMNIWADKERPALRNLRARGVVTNMYLIDIRDYFGTGSDQESVTVYDYDIVTDRTTGISNRVFRRGLLMDRDVLMNDTELAKTDEQHALRKRACTYDDGLESEISGYDYFAGWYDSDYPV